MIKKIRSILTRKQLFSFALMAVLLFIGGIFDLLGVSLILPIANLAMDAETLTSNQLITHMCDLFNLNSINQVIIFLLLMMIGVYIIKNGYLILMYKTLYHFT